MSKLVFIGDGSSKFWEGQVAGAILTVRWGKIGTAGQSKDKTFGTAGEAQKARDFTGVVPNLGD